MWFLQMLANQQLSDLRGLRSLDRPRLLLALAVSLLLHLMVYGVYSTGQALGLWEKLHWSQLNEVVEELQEAKRDLANPDAQPPLLFVDVNPAAATSEAPEDARYYSDKSSRAANPLADKESDIPLVDGTQDKMVRTEDIPPVKAMPLQPSPPAPTPPPPTPEPTQAETKLEVPKGDMVIAKAEEPRKKPEPVPPDPKPRPRTLKEAMARLPEAQVNRLAGQKMRQDGGVRRLATSSALDVKASPFGDYDRAIIVAIQNRWFDLLDMRGFGHEKSGRVVLNFRLHQDGRITNMDVTENTVDEMLSLLCQKAILDPAPYARWPSDMRRMIGADYREVRFTFYYN